MRFILLFLGFCLSTQAQLIGPGAVASGNVKAQKIFFTPNTVTQLASDNFNTADGPISGNWIFWRNWTVGTNQLVTASLASDNVATWGVLSIPADQYSEANISVTGTGSDTGYGVALRCATNAPGTGFDHYRIVVSKAGSGNIKVDKRSGGAYSAITTSPATITVTWVDGDLLRATIVGSTITIYQNGTQIGTATDSTLAAGNPGIAYSSTATDGRIDNWAGGSVP